MNRGVPSLAGYFRIDGLMSSGTELEIIYQHQLETREY